MRRLVLLLILIAAPIARGQGFFYKIDPAAPDATIRICAMTPIGPTTNPCVSPVPIYNDMALSVPARNPVSLGPDGAYAFWIAAGQYFLQYSGSTSTRTVVFSFGGSGGGGGCDVSALVDEEIVFIHPSGTCNGSPKLTWDNTNQDLAAGNANTFNAALCPTCTAIGDNHALASGNSGAAYSEHTIGYQNTIGQGVVQVYGDQNSVKGDELIVIGQSNSLNVAGTSPHLQNSLFATTGATMTLSGPNARAHDFQVVGSDDIFSISAPSGPAINLMDCLHGIGGHNTFTLSNASATDGNLQKISWVGKDNTFTVSTGVTMQEVTVAGNSGTFTGAIATGAAFGNSLSLTACADCYAVGESVVNATNNTLALGMSATPELVLSTNRVTLKKLAFASLPACAAGTEGSLMPVTDSTTQTWGATVTGGAGFHILAYCDGTVWTVAAK